MPKALDGTSFVMTEPAPIIAPLPVVTFPTPPALPPVILQDIRPKNY